MSSSRRSLDNVIVRRAITSDEEAVWSMLEPVIRDGKSYALPRDWPREDALGYWFDPDHEVFVATEYGAMVGTYFLRANQLGGGSHVANCGYIISPSARGRGLATHLCLDSCSRAAARGFTAMQFNFVVSTNTSAIRAWEKAGFAVVGHLPGAFQDPQLGFVDALIMHRTLSPHALLHE